MNVNQTRFVIVVHMLCFALGNQNYVSTCWHTEPRLLSSNWVSGRFYGGFTLQRKDAVNNKLFESHTNVHASWSLPMYSIKDRKKSTTLDSMLSE